jgi:O-antigen/teichoic acid export membrane protein
MIKKILSTRLFKNMGVYMVSSIINAAIPFLLLPVLTRYLSPNDYGITATFQSLTGLFSFLVGLNTQTAVIRRFYDDEKVNYSEYISNCLLILFLSTALLLALLLPFSEFIGRVTEFPRKWLWTIVIVSFFQYLFSIILGVWQVRGKVYYYAMFQNSQTLLNILLSLLFIIFLGMNWQGRILGQTISTAAFGIISLLILSRLDLIKSTMNRSYLSDALKFGVPLIPYSFTGWILLSMDRILLNNLVGLRETGLYSVAYQLSMIIALFQISFNTAWVPWLYEKIKLNDAKQNISIVRLSYVFILANFLLAALLVIAGPPFIKLFIGKSFYGATEFLWWLCLAQAANGIHIVAVTYVNYHNKNIYLTYSAVFTALVHIPVTYLLIKLNGTKGAAQSFFISSLLTSILTFGIAVKFHRLPWLIGLRKSFRLN